LKQQKSDTTMNFRLQISESARFFKRLSYH